VVGGAWPSGVVQSPSAALYYVEQEPTMSVRAAEDFEMFFTDAEPRLRRALVAALGGDRGREATAEALAWAWEHWERLRPMTNPVGYLYRVGRSRTRGRRHPVGFAPASAFSTPWVEPAGRRLGRTTAGGLGQSGSASNPLEGRDQPTHCTDGD
jgi:hypothetical protein